jgi:hypothetical protein
MTLIQVQKTCTSFSLAVKLEVQEDFVSFKEMIPAQHLAWAWHIVQLSKCEFPFPLFALGLYPAKLSFLLFGLTSFDI